MDADLEKRKKRRIAGKYPEVIFVRATEDEALRITANAKQAGRSCSRFLAEVGALKAGQLLAPSLSPEEMQVIRELMYRLHTVALSLRQLAHREQSPDLDRSADPHTASEIRRANEELTHLLRLLRSHLR